jgi:HEAT repeat protein
MNAQEIIQLLEEPTNNRWPMMDRITAEAPLAELVAALQDPSSGVRGSAVEALTNIGNPSTGDALMALFNREEPDEGMRRLFLAAFGAVGYRPALPLLLQGLQDPDETTRQCAAWGLGKLKAPETREALRHALKQETDRYAAQVIREALKAVRPLKGSQSS